MAAASAVDVRNQGLRKAITTVLSQCDRDAREQPCSAKSRPALFDRAVPHLPPESRASDLAGGLHLGLIPGFPTTSLSEDHSPQSYLPEGVNLTDFLDHFFTGCGVGPVPAGHCAATDCAMWAQMAALRILQTLLGPEKLNALGHTAVLDRAPAVPEAKPVLKRLFSYNVASGPMHDLVSLFWASAPGDTRSRNPGDILTVWGESKYLKRCPLGAWPAQTFVVHSDPGEHPAGVGFELPRGPMPASEIGAWIERVGDEQATPTAYERAVADALTEAGVAPDDAVQRQCPGGKFPAPGQYVTHLVLNLDLVTHAQTLEVPDLRKWAIRRTLEHRPWMRRTDGASR